MNSIRKWFYRPKREDPSKLVRFYYADEELNLVAAELDSFDGHKDPDRCSALVNQLRLCQDKVLNICNDIMDEAIPSVRANRDFRIKFPDEMLHENLAGQLWFGAECLSAGSNVANREEDSEAIRPLAKAVTKALDDVRNLLRDHCFKNTQIYSEKLKEALEIFDRLFAEFELRYVRILVPVKTLKECHRQQDIVVLFSETLQRALKIGFISQEMIDNCDPSIMFAVPRLAIVCGLIIYPDGPLNLDLGSSEMSDLFQPFYNTLCEIRELLWTLSSTELSTLEKMLCSTSEFQTVHSEYAAVDNYPSHKYQNYVNLFLQSHQSCEQFIQDFYGCNVSTTEHNQDIACSSNITDTWQVQNIDRNKRHKANPINSSNSVEDSCSDNEFRTNPYIPSVCINVTQTSDTDNEFNSCHSRITSHECNQDSFDVDLNGDFCHNVEQKCVTCSTEGRKCLEKQQNRRIENGNHISDNLVSHDKIPQQYFEDEASCILCSEQFLSNNAPVQSDFQHQNVCDHCQENRSHCECSDNQLSVQQNKNLCSRKTTKVTSSESENFSNPILYDRDSRLRDQDVYNSLGYTDDEAIALALQTAEIASRNEARSNYKTSKELIHKLFVVISGVADQLQTNYASDLRNILKPVFDMNSSHSISSSSDSTNVDSDRHNNSDDVTDGIQREGEMWMNEEVREISAISVTTLDEEQDRRSIDSAEEAIPEPFFNQAHEENFHNQTENFRQSTNVSEEPPPWVPDEIADHCMACDAQFTLLRRRHHCRNCGKIFCSRCSSYSVSLPHYGHMKPVRVCQQCFVHQVTQYVVAQSYFPSCPPF